MASVGFMPAGPRLAATRAVLRICFFPLQGGGRKERAWAGSSIACFVAPSYASAGTSPTVGLPSAHRAFLGLRRLHAGGAKTCSYKGHIAGLFFSAARRRKKRKGLGRIVDRMLCSCKLRLRRDEPDGRLTQRPSSSSWPPSASCCRGQDLQLQRPCCGSVFSAARRRKRTTGWGRSHERFALTECDEGALNKSKTPDRALRSNALFVRFLVLVLSIAVLVLVLDSTQYSYPAYWSASSRELPRLTIGIAAVQTAIEYEYRFTEYRFTEYEYDEIRCEARPAAVMGPPE